MQGSENGRVVTIGVTIRIEKNIIIALLSYLRLRWMLNWICISLLYQHFLYDKQQQVPFEINLFGIQIFWPWEYLMKVIPETCRVHYIWYLRFYYRQRYTSVCSNISLLLIYFVLSHEICFHEFEKRSRLNVNFISYTVPWIHSNHNL